MGRQIRRREPGFTLVELLVVVSIIALLVSILFPSLGKSRKQARAAVCGAHLHQLGIATELYVVENGCFPPHKSRVANPSDRWPIVLAQYVRSEEFQICPAVSDWKIGRNNPYGYNYKYLGCMRENAESPTAPFERFTVRGVASPSMTIAYADSDGTGWRSAYHPTQSNPEALGNHGYTLDPTFIPSYALTTVTSQGEPEPYSTLQDRTYVSTRHQGAFNALFADSHVERMTPREVYRDNRYWNGLGREDAALDPHVAERSTGPFRFEADLR